MSNVITTRPTIGEVEATAYRALKASLSVVAIRPDGSKAPIAEWDEQSRRYSWDEYKRRQPTPLEIKRWYRKNPGVGLGIVCGAVSGNLELLDFDRWDYWLKFRARAEERGLGDLINRIVTGYFEKSPKPGGHLVYRCTEPVEKNLKLARRIKVDDQGQPILKELPNGKRVKDIEVLIETRGEGGQFVAAPSGGKVHPSGRSYELISGSVETIVTITAEERQQLLDLARSFDDMPQKAKPQNHQRQHQSGEAHSTDAANQGGRVGDEFNQRGPDWTDILEPHGWTVIKQEGDKLFWCRPGKTQGISATSGYAPAEYDGPPLFHCFTSSTEFEPDKNYTRFSVYSILEHDGDFKAATKALAKLGYGKDNRKKNAKKEQAQPNPAPWLATEVTELFPLPKIDRTVNKRYLEAADLRSNKKVLMVKGYKGGGKSSANAALVQTLRPEATILDPTHRVSLSKERSQKLSLESYLDFRFNRGNKQRLDVDKLSRAKRLTICIDSLKHFAKAEGRDWIFWDEVEQGLVHLCGSTILESRKHIYKLIRALIKNSLHVVVMDADLSGIAYSFFASIVGEENIEVLVNEYTPQDAAPIYAYGGNKVEGPTALTQKLISEISAGRNPFVGLNNRKEALRLHTLLCEQFPTKQGICITQDNSDTGPILDFVANINTEMKQYDWLVCSPTLGTGVDIYEEHFDCTFIFGFHASSNHRDLLQQMMRNRRAKAIYVWIDPSERHRPTSLEYWKKATLDRAERIGMDIGYSEKMGERIVEPHEVDFLELNARIAAADSASRNKLAANFYAQAKAEGHPVTLAWQPEAKKLDLLAEQTEEEKALEETLNMRLKAKRQVKEARITALLDAADINEEEAKNLDHKIGKTPEERAELERHQIATTYAKPVDRQLIEMDNEGRFRPRLYLFEMLMGYVDPVERDRKNFEDSQKMLKDLTNYTTQVKTVKEILRRAGIDFTGVKEFTAEDLHQNGWVKWCIENQGTFYPTIGKTLREDFEDKPVEFIGEVLKKVGIKLVHRRKGKRREQVYVYRVDIDSIAFMTELADVREKVRQEKEAALMEDAA